MFAINCSNASFNHQCIFSMRCCIASLESLEDTLVPALIAYYTDSDNQSKRLLLKTLSNHWSDEIVLLENLLHRVIDTAAMSKIMRYNTWLLSEHIIDRLVAVELLVYL
ncbi:uncharacterized protein LOC103507232 [Diaphorina citri]|uniref:Uncharacterized protein LOC103507232 n=1 Tax=Diaphorina citri TaxID=121845 RepID=A0A3Q0INY0_DIACI|nr:uncharacterized protein LOC103507232 [Diaphorina citri]